MIYALQISPRTVIHNDYNIVGVVVYAWTCSMYDRLNFVGVRSVYYDMHCSVGKVYPLLYYFYREWAYSVFPTRNKPTLYSEHSSTLHDLRFFFVLHNLCSLLIPRVIHTLRKGVHIWRTNRLRKYRLVLPVRFFRVTALLNFNIC